MAKLPCQLQAANALCLHQFLYRYPWVLLGAACTGPGSGEGNQYKLRQLGLYCRGCPWWGFLGCCAAQPVTNAAQAQQGWGCHLDLYHLHLRICNGHMKWGEGWFRRQSTCQHQQWEAPAQPRAKVCAPVPQFLLLSHGTHPGVQPRHRLIFAQKKTQRQEKHKIPWGWEQEGFQPDKAAPYICFLLPAVNKPFNVFKATNNRSAAVNKFSTAEI